MQDTNQQAFTPLPDRLRSWACDAVDIEPTKDAKALHAAMLQRVTEMEFMPPDDWHDAIAVLADSIQLPAETPPLGFYHVGEVELRREVERFVESFFDVPVQARQTEWQRLYQRSEPWPALRRWLEKLEPGLQISSRLGDHLSMSLLTFGDLICQTFLYPAGPQARDVWAQLANLKRDPERWEPVARLLCREFPDLARLQQSEIDEFLNYRKIRRHKARQEFWQSWTRGWIKTRKSAGATHSEGEATSETASDFRVWPLVVVCSTLGIMIARFTEDSKRSLPSRPGVNYSSPGMHPPTLPNIDISPADFERLRKAQRHEVKGNDAVLKMLIEAGVIKVKPGGPGSPNPLVTVPGESSASDGLPPPPPLPVDATDAPLVPPAEGRGL